MRQWLSKLRWILLGLSANTLNYLGFRSTSAAVSLFCSKMSPTILFVPGFWEGAAPFADVSARLQSKGFQTEVALLPSTGTTSPGNPSMQDDIAAIRQKVSGLVDAGHEIIMVLHSGGSFLGSNAIEGLTTQGSRIGVSRMVFLAGAVFPEGFEHSPLPFYDIQARPFRSSKFPSPIIPSFHF